MRKLIALAALAASIAGGSLVLAADSSKDAPLVCPVSGEKIASVDQAAGKSVYKGKTYYFCCAGCKPKFDKNPEKYIHPSETNGGK